MALAADDALASVHTCGALWFTGVYEAFTAVLHFAFCLMRFVCFRQFVRQHSESL